MDGCFWPALRLALIGGAAAMCLPAAAPATAQVIEVGPEGATTLSGPAVTTSEGRTPIIAATPAAKPLSGKPLSARAAAKAGAALPLLERAGAASDLSARLLEAIAYVESRFDPQAISPKGAVGMMQLMPATAAELGVAPHDPEANARGGAAYLRRMLAEFDNNVELAVAAYNAGPAAVKRHGGVPPYRETQAYVAAVMDYLATAALPED